MADMKEGFLCPICMADLGDLIQLQLHFEEKHSRDTDMVQNIKDLFGKAKKKILVAGGGSDEDSLQALTNELALPDQIFNAPPSSHDPVSGIHKELLESQGSLNIMHGVSHMEYFRSERSKRADMKAMDTNKLILRLERLMTSLPVDPVKRRAHEQSVVTWLPEDAVKLCPNCAKSFNLTRRKHHCRLCGAIMCADCSNIITFELANRLIRPATIAKFSPIFDPNDQAKNKGPNTPKKSYDTLVSNLADLTGFSESQSHFRSCFYCREVLDRRDAQIRLVMQPPTSLVTFYTQLQRFMNEGASMSQRYRDIAAALNSGDGSHEQLSEAKVLRLKLLKLAEIVDATSKKILQDDSETEVSSAGDSNLILTLRQRIRASAVNFIKDTLVGLPSVPSDEELSKLQINRKKDLEKKIAEEKLKAQEAKLRYEQQQQQRQQEQYSQQQSSTYSSTPGMTTGNGSESNLVRKFLSPSPSINNLEAVKSQISNAVDGLRQKTAMGPRKSLFSAAQPTTRGASVNYGSGFVAKASEAGGPDLDPLVQQMHNLRQFISQARSAGKADDANILEQNLRDLQEEYQKIQERRELEDNYVHFKSVFGSHSPTKGQSEGRGDNMTAATSGNDDEEELDESNPFFEDDKNPFQEDLVEADEKNPFF